jgi:hypothetical protein
MVRIAWSWGIWKYFFKFSAMSVNGIAIYKKSVTSVLQVGYIVRLFFTHIILRTVSCGVDNDSCIFAFENKNKNILGTTFHWILSLFKNLFLCQKFEKHLWPGEIFFVGPREHMEYILLLRQNTYIKFFSWNRSCWVSNYREFYASILISKK